MNILEQILQRIVNEDEGTTQAHHNTRVIEMEEIAPDVWARKVE